MSSMELFAVVLEYLDYWTCDSISLGSLVWPYAAAAVKFSDIFQMSSQHAAGSLRWMGSA